MNKTRYSEGATAGLSKLPAAPAAIAITGMQQVAAGGPKDFETRQELTNAAIRQIMKDYGQASGNTPEAGC